MSRHECFLLRGAFFISVILIGRRAGRNVMCCVIISFWAREPFSLMPVGGRNPGIPLNPKPEVLNQNPAPCQELEDSSRKVVEDCRALQAQVRRPERLLGP